MLIITHTDGSATWHVGQPLPKITGRVVTFQADCDELDVILDALLSTAAPVRKEK